MISIDSLSSSVATSEADVPEQAQLPEEKLAKTVEAKKAEIKAKAEAAKKAASSAADSAKQVKSAAIKAAKTDPTKSAEFDELLTKANSQDQKDAIEAQTKGGTAPKTETQKKVTNSGTNSSLVKKNKSVSQDALVELAAAGLAASASQQAAGTQGALPPKNDEAKMLQDKLIAKNPKGLMPAAPKLPKEANGAIGPGNPLPNPSTNATNLAMNQAVANPQQIVQPIVVNLPPPVIMAIPIEMDESDLRSVDVLNPQILQDDYPMSTIPAAFAGVKTEDYLHDRNQMQMRNYPQLENRPQVPSTIHKQMHSPMHEPVMQDWIQSKPLWLTDPQVTQSSPSVQYTLPQVIMAGAAQPVAQSQVSEPQYVPIRHSKQKVDITNPSEVSNQIWGLANKGGGEVKVKIHPQELGELTIHVSNTRGKLNVKMESSSREAQEILKQALPELRSRLSASNYEVAHIEVNAQSVHSVRQSIGSDSGLRAVAINPWELAEMSRNNSSGSQSGRDSSYDSNSNQQSRYSQDYQQQGRGNGYKRYYDQYLDS